MKFQIPRADLLTALSSLNRIVEKRTTIPILSNIRITTGYDCVNFEATDLELSLTRQIAVGREGEVSPGAITAPAHVLGDIIRKLPDGAMVGFEHKDALTIFSGRSRFNLQTLPAIDFPDMVTQSATDAASFEINGALLLDVLSRVEFAISSEEHRYYLGGIYLDTVEDGQGKSLVAVATDGHRLSKVRILPCESLVLGDNWPKGIVPRKTVAALKTLASEAGIRRIKIEMTATKIKAKLDGTVLVSKLVDGTFPDYQRVIPAGNRNRIALDSEDLAKSLDLVSAVSSEKGRAAKWEITPDFLVLTVNNPDAGSAEQTVEHVLVEAMDCESLQIGFNTRYALDMVAAMKAERVEAAFGDSGTPALFRPAIPPGDIDHIAILMPMRV